MKVSIEREECTSCAVCWDECPDYFEENPDDEFSQVVPEHRIDGNPAKGRVTPELEECVREAAEECPVEIIHIEG